MNSLAIGKEPSVSCIVVALERQISLVVSCLVVGALNQDVLECKLFIICRKKKRVKKNDIASYDSESDFL